MDVLGGRHPRWTRGLLSDDDFDAVAQAVVAAERQTSGEIRVHLERRMPAHTRDALARATELFEKLGMTATAERSGVLIYVAIEDRKLAIAGDAGVHAHVGDEYWQRIRDVMVTRLRDGRPREALVHAVSEVGEVLRRFFPRRPDDRNELSDEVSLG
ncbi:MAG TPA: TPM domain-containing protein [Methylomirabilota bacterium]|nr:TPM domain-containing protein [Methylomirabilota bacterium]